MQETSFPVSENISDDTVTLKRRIVAMYLNEFLEDIRQGLHISAAQTLRSMTGWSSHATQSYLDDLKSEIVKQAKQAKPDATPTPKIDAATLESILYDLEMGQRISAVKAIRTATGENLKVSKNIMERMERLPNPFAKSSLTSSSKDEPGTYFVILQQGYCDNGDVLQERYTLDSAKAYVQDELSDPNGRVYIAKVVARSETKVVMVDV